MKAVGTFTVQVASIWITGTTIDTKQLSIFTISISTIIGCFILTVSSAKVLVVAFLGVRTITRLFHSISLLLGNTFPSMKTMMFATSFGFNLTLVSIPSLWTFTIHSTSMIGKKVHHVKVVCVGIAFHSKATISVILTIQITIRNRALFKFTVRSILANFSTAAGLFWMIIISIFTNTTIDTKDRIIFITANIGLNQFTIFSNIVISSIIRRSRTITKHLIIPIGILNSWNTLSAVVTLVRGIRTGFIFPSASQSCPSWFTFTMLPITL
mmetsp:Transcript_20505/g.30367  ORF Transcript_20505/g.30367 Transcript_20505/m.30367 type:complete len:269 (+) Transcript_20505:411-1217(+)